MVTSRRAIIICHPDFDLPGSAGIKAAQEYAENLAKGSKMALQQSQGVAGNPKILELRKYLNGFEYKIRKLPGDVL